MARERRNRKEKLSGNASRWRDENPQATKGDRPNQQCIKISMYEAWLHGLTPSFQQISVRDSSSPVSNEPRGIESGKVPPGSDPRPTAVQLASLATFLPFCEPQCPQSLSWKAILWTRAGRRFRSRAFCVGRVFCGVGRG